MNIDAILLAGSFISYLIYLLISAAEHFLSISNGLTLRHYLEGTKWHKISRVYDIKNLQVLTRTTSFLQILTFIGCPVLFVIALHLQDLLLKVNSALIAAGLLAYIYLGGYFFPYLLTKAVKQNYVVFLLRFAARMYNIVHPFLIPADFITSFLRRGSSTTEDLRLGARTDNAREYIKHGKVKGFFKSDEEELLHSVVEFGDTTVKEVMTPRVDMVYIHRDITIEEMLKTVLEHNHSRYPVYDKNIDDIIGILNIQDLFNYWGKENRKKTIRELIRESYFVPESKMVDDLLREMQRRHIHMAIVVDEYGGTAGLVTLEDLLEEIVGEIQDEYEKEELDIVKTSDGDIIALGKTDIDVLEDVFAIPLAGEDYESIGGMIYGEMGRVPKEGERIKVKGLDITILEVEGRKIEKVKIRKMTK